jgi:hypothetical protein
MTIASSAVLVELNISVWTAACVDKRVTDSVLSAHGAGTSDAGQFRKNLMAGTPVRKHIVDFAANCRLWHSARTLPWADRGTRLLPTSLFIDYKAEANKRRSQFELMVDRFIQDYPQLQATAQQNLGAMYDPADYPSTEEVAQKFGFRLTFLPLPEAGDFRLDVAKEELEDLRKQYDSALSARVEEAMQSQWERLHTMLMGMVNKLTDPETDGDTEIKRRWHDTFITNAQDLCEMLSHLNVTKNVDLEEARLKLQAAIAGVGIEDIKESAGVRADVRERLAGILKDYEW